MRKILSWFIAIILLFGGTSIPTVQAAALAGSAWSSVIHYYNPNSSSVQLNVVYYRTDGSDAATAPLTIPAHGSGKFYMNDAILEADFQGSAVVSSSLPLLAVILKAGPSRDAFSPLLSASFTSGQAGTGKFYIPLFQRTPAFDPVVGVQNIEPTPVRVDMTYYPDDGSAAILILNDRVIPGQASVQIRSSGEEFAGFPPEFDGSLVIQAVFNQSPYASARIVASVDQTQANEFHAISYEGSAGIATELYAPQAACQWGDGELTSLFDVQNAGSSAASISITYYDIAGQVLGVQTSAVLQPGTKVFMNTCDLAEMGGLEGSAVIRSTQPISAVTRVITTTGLLTAFTAQPKMASGYQSGGYYRVAIPYAEYSSRENGDHAIFIIQNASDALQSNITANYYAEDGSLMQSQQIANNESPLPAFASILTDPNSALVVDPTRGGFSGTVEIVSGAPVVVLVRIQRNLELNGFTLLGEDYSGVPVKP
jgi:hypothetical protein